MKFSVTTSFDGVAYMDYERTESSELRALLAWHDAFDAAGIPGYDWRIERVGDALCSISSSDPSILLNRVLNLGSQQAPSVEQLREIRHLYTDAGIERFFLHVVPGRKRADTEALLAEAGYTKYRGWMKFVRGAGDVRKANSDLQVRQVGPEHGADFATIVVPAFDMLPVSLPVVALLTSVENKVVYMSFDGDRPAGTGAIFIDGNTAALDWGATHPDFRRRGGQTAVLEARIRHAIGQGCELICTMTGEAVPGDPQHSYSNIQKNGFAEAYLRENWIT
jgi:ribosomal protein S18 acetylase RimI-like enzyme